MANVVTGAQLNRSPTDMNIQVRQPRGAGVEIQEGPSWVLQPEGANMLLWDLTGVVLLMWTVTIVPIKFGFDVIDLCPDPMWVIDAFIDLFFCADLLLNFVTATYVIDPKTNEEVLSRKLSVIARNYLRGWFAVDIMSSLPINPILSVSLNGCDPGAREGAAKSASGASLIKLVRILRLVKLLKILRILKLKQRLDELTDSLAVNIDMGDRLKFQLPYVIKALQILLITMYLTHLMACGFYYIGAMAYYSSNLTDPDNDPISWLPDANVALADQDGVLKWHEVGPPYVASLYWVSTTITTVGYGDLSPRSTAERIYAIFCMIFGTGLFGFIMGSVTALLSTATTKQDLYRIKLQQLQSFMMSKKLPHDLQVRIRRYFRFYWERNGQSDDDENEVMAALSTPLRQETLRFLYSSTIAQLAIFGVVEDDHYHDLLVRSSTALSMTSMICRVPTSHPAYATWMCAYAQLLSMAPLVCCPGENLIQQGQPGTKLYVITKGQIGIYYKPNDCQSASNGRSSLMSITSGAINDAPVRLVARLGAGGTVGEIALFGQDDLGKLSKNRPRHVRTATVRAVDYSEIFTIDAQQLRKIWAEFPALKSYLLTLAQTRLKELEDIDVLFKSSGAGRASGLKWMGRARTKLEDAQKQHGATTSILSSSTRKGTFLRRKKSSVTPAPSDKMISLSDARDERRGTKSNVVMALVNSKKDTTETKRNVMDAWQLSKTFQATSKTTSAEGPGTSGATRLSNFGAKVVAAGAEAAGATTESSGPSAAQLSAIISDVVKREMHTMKDLIAAAVKEQVVEAMKAQQILHSDGSGGS